MIKNYMMRIVWAFMAGGHNSEIVIGPEYLVVHTLKW